MKQERVKAAIRKAIAAGRINTAVFLSKSIKIAIIGLALSSFACSKRVIVSVETGQKRVVRPTFWSDKLQRGDTIANRKGELYTVKY